MQAMLVQFAASLAAVSALVWLAWKLGFSGPPQLEDEHEARLIAREASGGFAPVAVALDKARAGALLQDAGGRVVLLAPCGAHFVAHLLGFEASARASEGRLEVRDGRLRAVLELGSAAEDWAAAIARVG